MTEDEISKLFNDKCKLLRTTEVMAYLNCSRSKLWELTVKNVIPAFKVGGDFRYKVSEVLEYLEKCRITKPIKRNK